MRLEFRESCHSRKSSPYSELLFFRFLSPRFYSLAEDLFFPLIVLIVILRFLAICASPFVKLASRINFVHEIPDSIERTYISITVMTWSSVKFICDTTFLAGCQPAFLARTTDWTTYTESVCSLWAIYLQRICCPISWKLIDSAASRHFQAGELQKICCPILLQRGQIRYSVVDGVFLQAVYFSQNPLICRVSGVFALRCQQKSCCPIYVFCILSFFQNIRNKGKLSLIRRVFLPFCGV